MNNVLYEELPEKWKDYRLNTWFQVGVQIYLLFEDRELTDFERTQTLKELLFADTDNCPVGEELDECVSWFLNGWCHDRSPREKQKRKLLDFEKDQWRIYADFRQIYGINLNEADIHWWEFMGMLWNMPQRQSSFLQVIEIRRKKIKKGMSKDEKTAIMEAQYIYGLDEPKESREYTEEEKKKIDDVDAIRNRMKAKRQAEKEALRQFEKR